MKKNYILMLLCAVLLCSTLTSTAFAENKTSLYEIGRIENDGQTTKDTNT